MPAKAGSNHAFISYVRDNADQVDRLANDLRKAGVEVWLDRTKIRPGAIWKSAIREAIRNGSSFIACFSHEYIARQRTYMNEELILAIEELRQRPINQEWFIPILFSPCIVPDLEIGAGLTLRDFHQVELFHNWEEGIQQILRVISPSLMDFQESVEAFMFKWFKCERIIFRLSEQLGNTDVNSWYFVIRNFQGSPDMNDRKIGVLLHRFRSTYNRLICNDVYPHPWQLISAGKTFDNALEILRNHEDEQIRSVVQKAELHI